MKRGIPFSKLNGSGNDFLLVDDRAGAMKGIDLPAFVRKVCDRSRSIGADGAIFIGTSRTADFRWNFFNADGSVAEMCGNGGRCAARFAAERRIAGRRLAFETLAGLIHAEVSGRRVKLQMTRPRGLALGRTLTLKGKRIEYSFVNTGVPHAVIFVPDIEKIDLMGTGRGVRTHRVFAPRGTNVDFARVRDGAVLVRTYERGVEGETLACGTGAVATIVVSAARGLVDSPVRLRVLGGELSVAFERRAESFTELLLGGGARFIAEGVLHPEAWS